ncbi:hypothetical protein K1T71_002124 [Dendrolimus kikuchii]|uniref:Uncharacterized protein n=1 Tax=Dendrolimus kikuchii TaxID=765133 RepID=A0ACC1DG20_9NEOP|nr:hypothetical protein K1T71_002124 [Dendrolimus kikuchii]
MGAPHLEVTWESYQNNICQGFTRLQQNEDFVDLTLAADGYLVKVHRNIFALASPYIKAMLKSVDCQHPVIFLNNVSYDILTYMLEYIYTGKVQVPSDMLDSFVEASKSLKIEGLEDISSCSFPYARTANADLDSNAVVSEVITEPPQSTSNFAALITINDENSLEIQKCAPDNIQNNDNDGDFLQDMNIDSGQVVNNAFDYNTTSSKIDTTAAEINESKTLNEVGFRLRDIELKPSYTISNRGALQLLLNRFIYSCHHQAHKGFKRRWRCINYRRSHCQAIIDTEGENVTARKGIHNHSFHDQKILNKCKNKLVFKTISQAASVHENT